MIENGVFLQAARFIVSGVFLTLLVSVLYLLGADHTSLSPALALTVATIIASIVGYFLHSAFSFAGHGERDRIHVRLVRFGITNAIGYLINLSFVFVLVEIAQWPTWAPVFAFCFITPAVSFLLNRNWVFR